MALLLFLGGAANQKKEELKPQSHRPRGRSVTTGAGSYHYQQLCTPWMSGKGLQAVARGNQMLCKEGAARFCDCFHNLRCTFQFHSFERSFWVISLQDVFGATILTWHFLQSRATSCQLCRKYALLPSNWWLPGSHWPVSRAAWVVL